MCACRNCSVAATAAAAAAAATLLAIPAESGLLSGRLLLVLQLPLPLGAPLLSCSLPGLLLLPSTPSGVAKRCASFSRSPLFGHSSSC